MSQNPENPQPTPPTQGLQPDPARGNTSPLVAFSWKALAAVPGKSLNGRVWTRQTLEATASKYPAKLLMVDHSMACRDALGLVQDGKYGVDKNMKGEAVEGLWLSGVGLTTSELWAKMKGEGRVPGFIRGVSVGGDGGMQPDGTVTSFDPAELSITPFPGIPQAEMVNLQQIVESVRSKMAHIVHVDPNCLNFSEMFTGTKLDRLYQRAKKFIAMIETGQTVPPIVVFASGDTYEVHDGHARVVAFRQKMIRNVAAVLMTKGKNEVAPSRGEFTVSEMNEETNIEEEGDMTKKEEKTETVKEAEKTRITEDKKGHAPSQASDAPSSSQASAPSASASASAASSGEAPTSASDAPISTPSASASEAATKSDSCNEQEEDTSDSSSSSSSGSSGSNGSSDSSSSKNSDESGSSSSDGSDDLIEDEQQAEEEAAATAAQNQRAKESGIAKKDQGHKTKPAKYKNIPDNQFADPTNYKYPIDKAHVTAAWSYINKPENQKKGGYSNAEWALMKRKTQTAMKKHGHNIADESASEAAPNSSTSNNSSEPSSSGSSTSDSSKDSSDANSNEVKLPAKLTETTDPLSQVSAVPKWVTSTLTDEQKTMMLESQDTESVRTLLKKVTEGPPVNSPDSVAKWVPADATAPPVLGGHQTGATNTSPIMAKVPCVPPENAVSTKSFGTPAPNLAAAVALYMKSEPPSLEVKARELMQKYRKQCKTEKEAQMAAYTELLSLVQCQ